MAGKVRKPGAQTEGGKPYFTSLRWYKANFLGILRRHKGGKKKKTHTPSRRDGGKEPGVKAIRGLEAQKKRGI